LKYQSNASWTKIPDSSDKHHTEEAAQAVCDCLLNEYNEYSPCSIRGVCTKAWVTETPAMTRIKEDRKLGEST